MRELGLPKVLTWRWAPCAALVVGSLAFVGFTLLAIPERIGDLEARSRTGGASLGNQFARTPIGATPTPDFSSEESSVAAATPSPLARGATRPTDMSIPKRGFSPPLERPAQPAPPPPPAIIPPPAPPPPAVPPAPPPAVEPAAPPPTPAPAEVMPQPQPMPPATLPEPPVPGAGLPPPP